jgi:hypothetical protein
MNKRHHDLSSALPNQWTSPPARYQYVYVADLVGRNSLVFTARGASNAIFALSDDQGIRMYEIVVGGWGNKRSAIRGSMLGNELQWYFQGGILSRSVNRLFWVSWNATALTVGRVCLRNPSNFQSCAAAESAILNV